jgi:hypothetical protein
VVCSLQGAWHPPPDSRQRRLAWLLTSTTMAQAFMARHGARHCSRPSSRCSLAPALLSTTPNVRSTSSVRTCIIAVSRW